MDDSIYSLLEMRRIVEMDNRRSAVRSEGCGGRSVGVVVFGNTGDPCDGGSVLDPFCGGGYTKQRMIKPHRTKCTYTQPRTGDLSGVSGCVCAHVQAVTLH